MKNCKTLLSVSTKSPLAIRSRAKILIAVTDFCQTIIAPKLKWAAKVASASNAFTRFTATQNKLDVSNKFEFDVQQIIRSSNQQRLVVIRIPFRNIERGRSLGGKSRNGTNAWNRCDWS